MFRDLSFRYKIPLRGTVLVLITSIAITSGLIFRAYDDLKQDLLANAGGLAGVMAHTLIPALLRDDLWRAYEIVRAPFRADPGQQLSLQADAILVLDTRQRIYVADTPRRFRPTTALAQAGDEFRALAQRLSEQGPAATEVLDLPATDSLYVTTPILSDGIPLGVLVMTYRRQGFTPRFARFAARAAVATVLVLGALLPLSWYWGARLAKPLVQLADCMGRVGREHPARLSCDLYESKDEIGRLAAGFKQMLGELEAKQALEQQMITAERLAAVGRLSASIAHEINNPLGGMLNAINTHRRYGQLDPVGERTFSLLERGLTQVRDTVSALLVETRASNRAFAAADAEDVRTLLAPDLARTKTRLDWSAALDSVPLPATLIRQVLINLLLNAAKVTPPQGRIGCRIQAADGHLRLEVANEGSPIPEDQLAHLFEPFVHYRPDGNGLGLWVCYQIVSQLHGAIEAANEAAGVRFTVTIPLPEELETP